MNDITLDPEDGHMSFDMEPDSRELRTRARRDMAIEITCPGASLRISGIDHDDPGGSGVYRWMPSNASQVIATANAMSDEFTIVCSV